MDTTGKLTKRQKKALAFRERKNNPKKEGNAVLDMEDTELPIMEDEDMASSQGGECEVERVVKVAKVSSTKDHGPHRGEDKGKQKQRSESAEDDYKTSSAGAKKRKRDGEPENTEEAQTLKRSKTGKETESKPAKVDKSERDQKFILFVGNLKYTTSKDAIQKHFSLCEPPPTIRLLTPKTTSSNARPSAKSKGCAFLEFQNKASLQQALKLHNSDLDGRMINVELTAGGGGKGETRLKKLKERNKELFGQRQKKEEKKNGKNAPLPERPQRYSATSGLEHVPATNRTWTVGDVEDGVTHRGGQRHKAGGKKGRGSRAREWGTGVNAIPVG